MAEINIEQKKNIWPWIIGLIVVLLLIWGAIELFDKDDVEPYTPPAAVIAPATDPVEPIAATAIPIVAIAPSPPPPTDADNEAIQVATITAGPAPFYGQPVVGTASVPSVPTDRGFWLEKDGSRMFALIAKSPNMEDAINVNAGQQVRLSGIVYPTSMASQIEGDLDAETRQILAGETAFLLVNANNVAVIDR